MTINIARNYNENKSEVHSVRLIGNSNSRDILPIVDYSAVRLITKIRVYTAILLGTDGWSTCVDILYIGSLHNDVAFWIDGIKHMAFPYKPIPFEPVPDDVSEIGTLDDRQPLLLHSFQINSYLDGHDTWPIS